MRQGSPPPTCHVSCVPCHMSHVTCHVKFFSFFFFSFGNVAKLVVHSRTMKICAYLCQHSPFLHSFLFPKNKTCLLAILDVFFYWQLQWFCANHCVTINCLFIQTRRYNTLCRPISSSCKGLCPQSEAFFALWAKNNNIFLNSHNRIVLAISGMQTLFRPTLFLEGLFQTA